MIKIDINSPVLEINQHGIIKNLEKIKPVKSYLNKFHSAAMSVFNEILYAPMAPIKAVLGFLFSQKYNNLNTNFSDKAALYALWHGLNGTPNVWNTHIGELERLGESRSELSVEIFAPKIPAKGHCDTNHEEVMKLFDNIAEWCKNNPGKPVVTFGQSNGSRFALSLEVYLRDRCPDTPVYISSTAGAIYGSEVISKLTNWISSEIIEKISFGMITRKACELLSYGSPSSQKLLREVRQPLAAHMAQRKYQMIGAEYDHHLVETNASLPVLNPERNKNKIEKHYLVSNYGHNSIVNACVEKQLKSSLNWINRMRGNFHHRLTNLNISLVKTEKSLIQVDDHRSLMRRIKDCIIALFKQIVTLAIKLKRRSLNFITSVLKGNRFPTPVLDAKSNTYVYPAEQLPWHKDETSDGLFLNIHGLRASTTDWEVYETEFKLQYPGFHQCIPQVVLRGNCALEIAAKPLLEVVKKYLLKFPGKPVTLIGTSNGGRIATYIESHIDPTVLGKSKLQVISIAGVHNGTKLIDFLDSKYLLGTAGLNPTLANEFHWNSQVAQENLKEWQKKQLIWNRTGSDVSHLFIATMEDENVWGQSASLPHALHNITKTKHIIYTGETHTSIVDAAFSKASKFVKRGL